MSLMDDILQLKTIKDNLASLKLNEINESDALTGLKVLGFEGAGQVSAFLDAARKVASDPSETVMQFLTNGDLAKLFNKSPSAKSGSVVVQCTHCGELNFIS